MVLTNSQDGARRLDALGTRAETLVCAPGLSNMPGDNDRDHWRAKFEIEPALPDDVPMLLVLGRIDRNKGLMTLLDALEHPRFTEQVQAKPWRLVVAGEIAATSYGRQVRQRLETAEHCSWVGFVDEPRPLLARADVLVQPSWDEAFGLAVREAMAWECAIVATAVGGLPEIIEDGVNGMLVKAGDVDGMARAMGRITCDQPLRRRLGERAAVTIQQTHDPASATRALEAAYQRVRRMHRH